MARHPRPTFAPTGPVPADASVPDPFKAAPAAAPVRETAPMSRWNGDWALEFTQRDGRFELEVEMAGGIMRILGEAVVRTGTRTKNVPVQIVMRLEDATELAPRLLGELNGSHLGSIPGMT